ncbi:GTP-binding protein [Prochlorococcus sp. MIT 1300]|uniref:YcjF family protein n=1 Tax=Prochlorococcus sp. MIT 1300 TaxID=3096218 RepID=UPI002A747539|nr:GTP-binding protein [Prochlorococcus sp. MIT 1300]
MMQRKGLLVWMLIAFTAIIVLSTLLQVFRSILWDLSYLLPGWIIGPLLLLLAAIIVISILQYGSPLWESIQKKSKQLRQTDQQPKFSPRTRQQAARQSLIGIDKLLEKLQDDIARESLQQERERVGKELDRGDLVVVVFGTGSSGKTSLIRALLNEIVGEVGAAMGSTTESATYRLRLKGFTRGLQLIDTPGILESGKDGKSREKEAKKKAAQADLMIVVVDGDIRSSELEAINSLTTMGKRLLLVLNKCDLRGEEEERRLIKLLRGHSKKLLDPEDVIPCSAAPQSIPRPGEKPLQPIPEIRSLLQRLAKVLHEDGEELLADNLLLQCKTLGEAGRRLLDKQRQKTAKRAIDRYSWISGGIVTATPLPGVDLLGAAAVNAQMVMEIAAIYGINLTRSRAQELAISVGRTLATLGVVKGGVSIIGASLSLNLPSLLLGRAIQGIVAAWLTRVAGASFITYFQQDQDWGDGGIQEVVQHHYDLNRRGSSLENFIATALREVVDPLQQKSLRQLPPRPRPREEEVTFDLENQER